ncbi:deoxyribonuclease V [Oscillatoria sp. CS-180]|uniref:deoxyribonuclease V n=1 Tax=Oscillatoria sp. CS-180 TaxID=3021720 RepID=UPI00232C85AD|nr:deoxyribonuclease V [Oscillatoria sp. CS-180]MDB9528636.1 deoxyribonuclease V [Oscillatoria sp. CS-180]
MDFVYPTAWPETAAEAIALQNELRSQISLQDELPESIELVAGVDAGFEEGGNVTRAAVVVLEFPSLQLVDYALKKRPTSFPYVPGLLSFREIPTVLDALSALKLTPDLILCDGQGLAHPRRFGIACHLGLIVDCPTIGVAKSRLVGTHADVPSDKGTWVPLLDKTETIGAVLRSRTNTNPLYISLGHRISLSTALEYVLRCTPKYRLPETTRLADRLASDRGKLPPINSGQGNADEGEQMTLL